jgi:hypothetical protein
MSKFRQCTLWTRENKYRALGLALLWALAFASILQGFVYAVRYSTDFQWSPTRLLIDGVNPYAVALSGNLDGKILMSQFPPYQHLLYIVFLPLALLPYTAAKWVWALINFGFACGAIAILRRMFRLSLVQALTLAGLFFIATPYRNAVGNGQTSLLCLVTLLIAWTSLRTSEAGAGVSLSLLLTKYSFAPPVLLWFLLTRKWRMLIASLICLMSGWLLFSRICHENPLTTLGQPLQVAAMYSEAEGGGDIMTLIQSFGWDRSITSALKLSSLAGLLTTCLWIGVLKLSAPRLTETEILTCLCLVSLLAIRHLAYDFVFVSPVAALALVLPRPAQLAAFALISYLWFGVKILDSFAINGKWVELASFLALNGLVVIVLVHRRGARGARWPA